MQNVGGTSYYYYAKDFGSVTATGEGGSDTANLYGSPGNDTLTVSPGTATMLRAGAATSTATDFVNVYGYAVDGGSDTDTATLTGTTGEDKFYGYETHGQLQNITGSTYLYRAEDFDSVTAEGGAGASILCRT